MSCLQQTRKQRRYIPNKYGKHVPVDTHQKNNILAKVTAERINKPFQVVKDDWNESVVTTAARRLLRSEEMVVDVDLLRDQIDAVEIDVDGDLRANALLVLFGLQLQVARATSS